MRWFAWLFTCTTCVAGYGGPLPEIEVGTSRREMVIQGPPSLPERGVCRAFLVGIVVDVEAEVKQEPQQTRLTESCTLQVESACGYAEGALKEVVGVKTAVLKAGYEQSPYVPAGDEWGRLWHFQKGQRLVVLLRHCEQGPCFDAEELMTLDGRTASLPDILRRTALDPDRFTEDDLAMLKLASPLLHQQFLAAVIQSRPMREEKARLRRETLMMIAGFLALAVLGIWGACRVAGKKIRKV